MISRVIALLLAACFAAGCGGKKADAQDNAQQTPGMVVALSDSLLAAGVADTIDFGRVREGEIMIKRFAFTNPTSSPMVILSTETTCGCVEADYSHRPIMPGESAQVSITFRTAGYLGYHSKYVAFRTNISPVRYRIIVTGDIY